MLLALQLTGNSLMVAFTRSLFAQTVCSLSQRFWEQACSVPRSLPSVAAGLVLAFRLWVCTSLLFEIQQPPQSFTAVLGLDGRLFAFASDLLQMRQRLTRRDALTD